jgi:DNA repair protein RecN (Recombination protein N)
MLAIKCLLTSDDTNVTLVFDEIDTGIGGATANAVALRLRKLAASHQVVVVTHLAQIAALADAQWVVSKSPGDNGDVATIIASVSGEERIDEIARMLSGNVDDASRAHARRLLEEGRN